MREADPSKKIFSGDIVEKQQAVMIAAFAFDIHEIIKNNPTQKKFTVSYIIETKERNDKKRGEND